MAHDRNLARRSAFVLSYIEGAFFAIMVGSSESFVIAYLSAYKFPTFQIALASTLPIFVASFLSALIPNFISSNRIKSSVELSVGTQILGLIGFCSFVLFKLDFAFLLLSLCLYWIGGTLAAPLWLDWMAGWLPSSKLRSFHSRRNSFVMFITVATFLSSSFLFHSFDLKFSFLLLFIIGLCSRIISLVLLQFQQSPREAQTTVSSFDELRRLNAKPWLLHALLILVLFKLTVGTSSPFFIPYKLGELNLPLSVYIWLTALPFVGRALILHQIGYARSSISAIAGLKIAIFSIALLPIMYAFSRDRLPLGLTELLGGAAWGLFEISLIVYIQSQFKGRARSITGLHNCIMAGAASLGALFGSHLFELFDQNFFWLFISSTVFRFSSFLAVVWIFRRHPQLNASPSDYRTVLSSVLSLRPSFASTGRIFLARKRRPDESTKTTRQDVLSDT
ncbi:MAG: hypothetical protein COV44_08035 [Deltaproteobacteria bacterium CG11_big_fil_rev_8_21_14_0_20_45_16]|nr:MAG: hypothetical protein COV44_08035 [Deltaproteobacteria bacterium CG11_big_fil_rev_8_21_14_0_20_45_16]